MEHITVLPVYADLEPIELPILEYHNWDYLTKTEEDNGFTALEGYIKITDRIGNTAYSSGWNSNEHLALYIHDGLAWIPYWYPYKYLPLELVIFLEIKELEKEEK